jgi:hypothetical protein
LKFAYVARYFRPAVALPSQINKGRKLMITRKRSLGRARRRLASIAAILALLGVMMIPSGVAMAEPEAESARVVQAKAPVPTAIGYDVFGAFCYNFGSRNICVPGATLGHYIKGDGRRITVEEGSISDNISGSTAGGLYCNWRIAWKYYDTNNSLYQTVNGPLHTACEGLTGTLGRRDQSGRTLAHFGRACAVFIVNGTERARQCHSISS